MSDNESDIAEYEFHEIEVFANKVGLGGVKIDGREIKGVTSFKVSAGIEELSEITLTLFAKNVKVKVDGRLAIKFKEDERKS